MINPIQQTLLTPRIKELPRGLIYKLPKSHFYQLIETKTGNKVGEMVACSEENENGFIYPIELIKKVFRIHSLEIDYRHQRKDWGSYFINFAKQESYRQGCKGSLYLFAYNPFEPPMIFYKKQGLVAKDKVIDEKLNSIIKNKNVFVSGLSPQIMYVPLETENKTLNVQKKKGFSFLKKIRTFIRHS